VTKRYPPRGGTRRVRRGVGGQFFARTADESAVAAL
jgi:hypothetical protein